MTSPRLLRFVLFSLSIAASCAHAAQGEDDWLIHDSFDYGTASLDGSDGGGGEWWSEWRRSAAGGVVLEKSGFGWDESGAPRSGEAGRHAKLVSRDTAGAYRDFNYISSLQPHGETEFFWLSFLARVEGGPFEVGSDEVSFQLRADRDLPLLTIGVMGTLSEWRIRADGVGRHFSRGAEKRPPEALSWIVVRVEVNYAPGGSDAVYLWVNPPGRHEPSTASPNARIIEQDLWNQEHPFKPSRLRIGTISTAKQGAEKLLEWDEIRMGRSFPNVSPDARFYVK